jgi:hypothetical protein
VEFALFEVESVEQRRSHATQVIYVVSGLRHVLLDEIERACCVGLRDNVNDSILRNIR